jgi:phosphate transport system substrate-binding protein
MPATAETALAGDAGTVDYGALSGDVIIDGSSTVEPISLAVAEEFKKLAPNVNVAVGRSGTGGGFEKFCNGETDISDASRAIEEDEAQQCQANGIEPVELQVGVDALAVVVNPANEFAQCLTAEQIVQIFQEGGAKNWNEIDPSYPAEPIKIYAPGADSGTFDYFTEHFELRGSEEEEPAFIGSYTASEDDNVLVQGIQGDRNAIGFFGYAYYQENEDSLTAIQIDQEGSGTCVAPSAETVDDGSYPLSRPLFIYPARQALEEKPQVAAYVQYYMSREGLALVEEVGYFPASGEKIAQARQSLASAVE